MVKHFKSLHNLPFEVAPFAFSFDEKNKWSLFRVGTCEGLWRCTDKSYQILAIENKQKHNGHLTDVLQWFEHSCKRDNKSLEILELWNDSFRKHLIEKQLFKELDKNNLIKKFN